MSNLNVVIAKDYEELSKKAAEYIASSINAVPNGVYGFATGGTPVGTYKALVDLYKEGKVDFSKITTFNLDEYYPILKSNENSYDYFMKENLFNHVNVDLSRINLPNGEAKDPALECVEYEKKIVEAGGIDMQLLGIGTNGHIGFNEPSDCFSSSTQLISLTQSTIEANKRYFESEEQVPKQAITMGIKTIMLVRKILILISGSSKAKIAKEFLKGSITPKVPASVLQMHSDVTVILDKEASAEL